jgi:hypothetical protein
MAPLYLKMVSSTWVDGIPERLAQIQPGASEGEVMDRLGRARALNGHCLTTVPMPGGRIRTIHEVIEHNDDWTMERHRYDLELVYSCPNPKAEWRFVSGRLIEAGSWVHSVN